MSGKYIWIELRLLILINGWSGKNISGGDYHILRVMREWMRSHQISVIIPLIGFLSSKSFLSDRYEIYLSSSGTKEIYSFGAIPAYLKRMLKTAILRFHDKPDMIVCSSHLLYDTLPGFIFRLRFRTRLVVYVYHIIGEHEADRTGILSKVSVWGEKLSMRLVRHADIVFVDNEGIKTSLIKMGFEPCKIFVSTNGVDYDTIASVRPVGEIAYNGCFCGRLVKTKGIYDLIEVWKLVTNRFPSASLAVVGDGPEYATFSNKIKEANLEKNIKLMGFVSERDKFLTMQRSKLFIFPSYEEGWGIAVAEAIACGLEVVLYDLKAYNFSGRIIKVEKGNSRKMAEVIVELIEKGLQVKHVDRQLIRSQSILDWKVVAKEEMQVMGTVQLE
jgi:glycosyltransferase involved in cell wall biosynthesis